MSRSQRSHAFICLGRCERQFASYVCPRCNLRYCSLACYKDSKHLECSETFYRDNVQEEIKARGLSESEVREMARILSRVQGNAEELDEQDGLEEEDEEDDMQQLTEVLSKLDTDENVDFESLLSKLPASHREEFEKFIKAGQLPEYEPWWMGRLDEKTNLVQPLEEDKEEEKEQNTSDEDHQIWNTKRPDLPSELPDFTRISKAQPSVLLNACLVNIIMTYCYLMRHLLGELYEHPANTCSIIERVSNQVLFSTVAGFPFSDIAHAATQTVDDVIAYEDGLDAPSLSDEGDNRRTRLLQTLLQDAMVLLDDSHDYFERALYDMWQILETLTKKLPKVAEKRKQTMLAARKAFYYFAYGVHQKRHEKENVVLLRMTVATEYERIKATEKSFDYLRRTAENAKQQMQSSSNNKIQEI